MKLSPEIIEIMGQPNCGIIWGIIIKIEAPTYHHVHGRSASRPGQPSSLHVHRHPGRSGSRTGRNSVGDTTAWPLQLILRGNVVGHRNRGAS